MGIRTTERRHDDAPGLDDQPAERILSVLHHGQLAAAQSVESAIPALAEAAGLAAASLGRGGRLCYAGAGSSGLMALADGLELPGTFGIAEQQIVIRLAEGAPGLGGLSGIPEDDRTGGVRDIDEAGLTDADCLIGVSASGSTPYVLGAVDAARARGAATIGLANNADSPLLGAVTVPVLLETPPEVVAGSTRMGAGSAQKIALNMLSTLVAVHLGHVHDGHMVNLRADNAKLRDRAERIVATIGNCDPAAAADFVRQAGGAVKPAILLAAGAGTLERADAILSSHENRLRPALAEIRNRTN